MLSRVKAHQLVHSRVIYSIPFGNFSKTPYLRIANLISLSNSICSQINMKIQYNFAGRAKIGQQLILHSDFQMEKIHMKRSNKKQKSEKAWEVFKQQNDKLKISLVGLPNCGKSSLFNCLIGQHMAIVDKQYGMTRDRRQYTILNGMVTVIDTPGIEVGLLNKNSSKKSSNQPREQSQQANRDQLKKDIFQQTLNAITESDLILFVIDGKKENISEEEIILAKYLKAFNNENLKDSKKKCEIVLVCNKCDGVEWDQNYLLNQIYSKLPMFNFQMESQEKQKDISGNESSVFYCSAAQGTGVFELINFIDQQIPHQMKEFHQKRRRQRREKFQELIKKMKAQIAEINSAISKNSKQQNQNNHQQNNQSTDQPQNDTFQKAQSSSQPNKPKNSQKIQKRTPRIKIKQWQNDFRQLNPNPQDNQELDQENYQDFFLRPEQAFAANKRGVDIKNLKMKHAIKICFIGRPNVGKSSLINQLLGEEKMVVSDVPHTTRDSLATKILYKNRKIELVDTAGLNTPKIQQNQEEFLKKAQASTLLHVKQAHVVVYVMDAFAPFRGDDFTLIKKVIDEGRPVIIVVNKWQAIKDQFKNKAKNYLQSQIEKNLGQLHGAPLVFVSAKMLMNLDYMMDQIISTYDKWNKRISTGMLNNWLQKFKKLDNLPKDEEKTLKINYIIQARVRPPHFIFFVNNKLIFKNNYMRFLLKNMSEEFKIDGIPLRYTLRSTNNKQRSIYEKVSKKHAKNVNKKKTRLQQKMQELKKKYGDFSI